MSESVQIKRINVQALFEEILRNLQKNERIPNVLLERQVFHLFQFIHNGDTAKKKERRDLEAKIAALTARTKRK